MEMAYQWCITLYAPSEKTTSLSHPRLFLMEKKKTMSHPCLSQMKTSKKKKYEPPAPLPEVKSLEKKKTTSHPSVRLGSVFLFVAVHHDLTELPHGCLKLLQIVVGKSLLTLLDPSQSTKSQLQLAHPPTPRHLSPHLLALPFVGV